MCFLEWCKLFADKKGKHYWHKLVSNKEESNQGLLDALGVKQEEFDNVIKETRSYRDKFLAHLDDERIMNIPAIAPHRVSIQ